MKFQFVRGSSKLVGKIPGTEKRGSGPALGPMIDEKEFLAAPGKTLDKFIKELDAIASAGGKSSGTLDNGLVFKDKKIDYTLPKNGSLAAMLYGHLQRALRLDLCAIGATRGEKLYPLTAVEKEKNAKTDKKRSDIKEADLDGLI